VNILREDVVPLIDRYVKERDAHVKASGINATALFPNLYRGRNEIFSANCFRKFKHLVVERSGVEFRLKDFRSTLCSLTINADLSRLPAMSAQLRHASVSTT
jgi:integrase